MSIGAAFALVIFPPACGMTLLVSELAFATRAMREAVEQGGSFPVCLSICVQRAALKTPPPFGRTLSSPESASRLSRGADYRYIGLCYGPPGVGKTLSARRYSRADSLADYDRWNEATMPSIMFDTVMYTAEVINTPSRVASDLGRAREKLTGIAVRPIEREARTVLETIRLRDEARRREILDRPGCSPCDRPAVDPIYFQTYQYYQARQKEVSDPTTLIIVDEADRLQPSSTAATWA